MKNLNIFLRSVSRCLTVSLLQVNVASDGVNCYKSGVTLKDAKYTSGFGAKLHFLNLSWELNWIAGFELSEELVRWKLYSHRLMCMYVCNVYNVYDEPDVRHSTTLQEAVAKNSLYTLVFCLTSFICTMIDIHGKKKICTYLHFDWLNPEANNMNSSFAIQEYR